MNSSPTIVITDSGLGGLSVLAELEKSLSANKRFDNPRLIFFNAVYEHHIGYNQLKTQEEKLHVFNTAFEAIRIKFNPDIIFIACNTLSVLYHETKFASYNSPKVVGIVEQGVEQAFINLKRVNESIVIVMGTPTTIDSHAHKNKLIKKGIEENRIIEQPCYYLESEIQINPESEKVYSMISDFTNDAMNKILVDFSKVFVLLACTHYEYAATTFVKVLAEKFKDFGLINPNKALIKNLTADNSINEFNTDSIVEIHSRVDITEEEFSALGEYLKNKSCKTYEAIKNYTWDRNLFNI